MLFPSLLRTVVPLAAGYVITLLAELGVSFPSEQVTSVATVGISGAYYTAFRLVEHYAPTGGFAAKVAGILLGYARPPEYPAPAAPVAPATPLAVAAPESTSVNPSA